MTPRIAVITGAARGIGAATAVRLAQDGLDIAVLDLDAARGQDTVDAVRAIGRRAMAVGADVTDEESVAAAIDQVTAELGGPTVLVNNAGVLHSSPLHKMELSDWRRLIDVHLTGAFLLSRATQQHMVAAKWGRIVNLSSIAAVGDRSRVHYSSAKAGLQGMTKTLAIELGRFGVTVNCVAPGFTVTDMTREVADNVGIDFDAMQAERETVIPVGRSGRPEDIANAIAFFVDERSGFVSGQVLYVAGGPVS